MDLDFNDRYGVRSTKGWITPAIVFALIGGGWLIWAALHHSDPAIRSSLISFNVTAEREISIRYSVRSHRLKPSCYLYFDGARSR
jgi:hypothetical protein